MHYTHCIMCGYKNRAITTSPYCTIACERAHIPRSDPQPEPYDAARDHMDDMTMYDEAETFYPEPEDTQ